MGHRFINAFKEGDVIEATYLVREKSFDVTKNGDNYIALELADRTGIVDARKWDASRNLFDSFNVDEFVKIKGKVEIYKGYSQLKVDYLAKAEEALLDISLYVPAVDKDRGQMFATYLSEIEQLKNSYLKRLLNNIFLNEETAAKFKEAPAATDFHHPYLGGLLEHTLDIIGLAKIVASRYPHINRDLLICGAALHDIGKIDELSYKRSFYYTDKGRLMGHITIGINIVEKEIDKISGFPEELKILLLHIILSHHGEQEWGSPKRPMCLEAVVLHYIDNLDAKINGFRYFVTTYNDPYSNWTKHSKMFGEFLYKRQLPDYAELELSEDERPTK